MNLLISEQQARARGLDDDAVQGLDVVRVSGRNYYALTEVLDMVYSYARKPNAEDPTIADNQDELDQLQRDHEAEVLAAVHATVDSMKPARRYSVAYQLTKWEANKKSYPSVEVAS